MRASSFAVLLKWRECCHTSSIVCIRGPKASGRATKSKQSVILRMCGRNGFRNLAQSLASSSALETSVDSLLKRHKLNLYVLDVP